MVALLFFPVDPILEVKSLEIVKLHQFFYICKYRSKFINDKLANPSSTLSMYNATQKIV